ncbi:MAG: opacity protein-like surface antigen [Lentisphaeria bacterium]|jgi:opacity protein-like surface antigen
MKTLLLTIVLISISGAASADHARGFYLGVNGTQIENKSLDEASAPRSKITFDAVELVGGYRYSSWLGLDVRYGNGISDEELVLDSDTSATSFSLDSYTSVYYRPAIINNEAKLYALIGYSQVDVSTTLDAVSTSFSNSGMSWGIGVGWFTDDHTTFNIEYRELLNQDGSEFTMATIGIDYRF